MGSDGMGWDGMGWDGMGWDGQCAAFNRIRRYAKMNQNRGNQDQKRRRRNQDENLDPQFAPDGIRGAPP